MRTAEACAQELATGSGVRECDPSWLAPTCGIDQQRQANGELRVAADRCGSLLRRSRRKQTECRERRRASSVTRARGCRDDGGVGFSPR